MRARRLITTVAAAATVVALAACSGTPGPVVTQTVTASSNVHTEGNTVVVALSPDKPLNLRIDGVATLTAPAGTVTSSTRLEVAAAAGVPAGMPSGFTAAGTGVSVDIDDGALTQPLTVTFDSAAKPSSDAVPVTLHVADDGTWTALPAVETSGKIAITTKSFSIQIPGWVSGAVDWGFDQVSGRTDPPACPPGGRPRAPGWSSLVKGPGSIHACLFNNTDSGGQTRAEIFVQSNRATYQVLRFPDGAQYSWMDPSTKFATLLGRVAHLIGNDEILLPAGGQASAGYTRPRSDGTRYGYAKVTQGAVIASVLAWFTDEAILTVAGKCILDMAGMSVRNPLDVADLLDCATAAAGDIAGHPDRAAAAIRNAIGDIAGLAEHADKLAKKTEMWKRWGAVLKTVALGQLVPLVYTQLGDAIADLNSDHQRLGLTLTAAPAPSQPAPPAQQPAPPVKQPAPQSPPTQPPTPGPGPATAVIRINTCNTYGNCTEWAPAWVHSNPAVSSHIGDVGNGATLTARCWATGRQLTDGSNSTREDNARQFTSTLWFGVDWNGGRGYVTSVWSTKSESHLGLPAC